jgi:hypothetical protein
VVSARELLATLRGEGWVLRPSPGGKLLATRAGWRATPGLTLTPQQAEQVRAHKLAILGLLAQEARDCYLAARDRVGRVRPGSARDEAEGLLHELAGAVDGYLAGEETAHTIAALAWRLGLVTAARTPGTAAPAAAGARS